MTHFSRRNFVFSSLKAAALLSPVVSFRGATAQSSAVKRVFFWVVPTAYPDAEAFFPTGGGRDFTLAPMMGAFEDLKSKLVVVDGIDIRNSGLKPKGNNHVRSMGKVLTAADVVAHPSDSKDGLPGGISIDQFIARSLGWRSLELYVDQNDRSHMRNRPFATGPRGFKFPILDTQQAWDAVFASVASDGPAPPEVVSALRRRRSVLDSLVADLRTFRRTLDGLEREKLDRHEDALVRAEASVASDLEMALSGEGCPGAPSRQSAGLPSQIPLRSQAHFDLMYAAFSCRLVGVGAMVFGYSGYKWPYTWLPNFTLDGNVHDQVHHRAQQQRDKFIRTASWDWAQLAAFARRLDETPEDGGTMLDNTLILALSHFGQHHRITRLPVVLLGGSAHGFETGRYLRLSRSVDNGALLTSVARWAGLDINGFGDVADSGPVPGL